MSGRLDCRDATAQQAVKVVVGRVPTLEEVEEQRRQWKVQATSLMAKMLHEARNDISWLWEARERGSASLLMGRRC